MKRRESAQVRFCPNQRPIPNRQARLSKKAEAALKKLLTVQWREFFEYLAFNKEPRQVSLKNLRVFESKTNTVKAKRSRRLLDSKNHFNVFATTPCRGLSLSR